MFGQEYFIFAIPNWAVTFFMFLCAVKVFMSGLDIYDSAYHVRVHVLQSKNNKFRYFFTDS